MTRVGIGYDVHRRVPGRGLRLGGVGFPRCGFRLEGHSDADVLVHALCDALLGAAALPDIGVLFPNTSARHRGRSSLAFLAEVRRRLTRAGWRPVNVDCTLLAEEPRLAPAATRMRRNLGRVLGLPLARISIKATTGEGIGCIGRREGLAAMAVALLEPLPDAGGSRLRPRRRRAVRS
jgi:2-C-methyl-D-erythritol 2,4-cyclodiphosphate synthase